MKNFDELNRQTREWNAHNVSHPISSASEAPKYGSSAYWLNYWNNQTYKNNNGQYSKHYY